MNLNLSTQHFFLDTKRRPSRARGVSPGTKPPATTSTLLLHRTPKVRHFPLALLHPLSTQHTALSTLLSPSAPALSPTATPMPNGPKPSTKRGSSATSRISHEQLDHPTRPQSPHRCLRCLHLPNSERHHRHPPAPPRRSTAPQHLAARDGSRRRFRIHTCRHVARTRRRGRPSPLPRPQRLGPRRCSPFLPRQPRCHPLVRALRHRGRRRLVTPPQPRARCRPLGPPRRHPFILHVARPDRGAR